MEEKRLDALESNVPMWIAPKAISRRKHDGAELDESQHVNY